MKISWHLPVGITGLVLMLWVGPSRGATPNTPTDILVDNDTTLRNTAGGLGALESNNATFNTAFGANALKSNIGGQSNTAVGDSALEKNEGVPPNFGGTGNTAVGNVALFENRSGNSNTGVGASALQQNQTGTNNTAVGTGALFGNQNGDNNTAVGSTPLGSIMTGSRNTAVGDSALKQLTAGTNNIAIGREAGITLERGSNNIYLGDSGSEQESNRIRIGSALQIVATFIAGIRDRNVGMNTMPVVINQNGRLGTEGSSARYKRDIQTMGTRSQGLLQLRPVTFRYKEDGEGELEYGLIAEEVVEVYPELVTRRDNGEVESVRYHVLIPMLLNETAAPTGATRSAGGAT